MKPNPIPRAILLFALMPGQLLFSARLDAAVAENTSKPNIIFILADDLGYADIGSFGSKLNRTPHLDRMAAEGRKLTCFYAAPVCSPSRSSLMTGCYPKRVLPISGVLFPGAAVGLNPQERTVAELLKESGYSTACIGKWHLGDQPEFLPTRQGFDYYLGLPYSNDMGLIEEGSKSNLGAPPPVAQEGKAKAKNKAKAGAAQPQDGAVTGLTGNNQPPLPLLENEKVIARVKQEEQQGIVERYTKAAVHFIESHKDKPFFLYLSHTAVHFPLYPGKAFHTKSSNGLYGDWVEDLDWSVGQVFDAVRNSKLGNRTLIFFTSDNGGTARAVNTPLRGFKASTWEGGMREPTLAWWPGRIPAGTSSDAVCGMLDILPTFVKLAGGKIPSDRKLDGGDIWPLLAGSPGATSPHPVFHYFRGFKLEAVRSGPWKLRLEGPELYNLENDIGEKSNVAESNPAVVREIQALADAMKGDLGVDGIGPGCRPLGRVANPKPLIGRDGTIREGFAP
jgi:arylsulfatase A